MSASHKNGDDGIDGIMAIPGAEDIIDPTTFEQILEMDDDEDTREFSKSIVFDFFGQAESTFAKMDTSLAGQEPEYLKTLSELGHFLKGSSATLGLSKVQHQCERIQNLGHGKDDTGSKDIPEKESREQLKDAIKLAKADFKEVKAVLETFYKDSA